jgi:isopenicillin N synthase-like dioxygenase
MADNRWIRVTPELRAGMRDLHRQLSRYLNKLEKAVAEAETLDAFEFAEECEQAADVWIRLAAALREMGE